MQIAASLEGIAGSVDVVEPAVGKDISDHLAAGRSIGELVPTDVETAEAVRRLTDLGLSRRDAAELLGLSHQRVQQLLEAS